MRRILFRAAATASLTAAAAGDSAAPDDDRRTAVEALMREFNEQRARDEARIADLEKRLAANAPAGPSDLQAQIDDLIDKVDDLDSKAVTARPSQAPTLKLIDVSFNSLFTA